MTQIKVLGIDLAKNVFQLHGLDSEYRKVVGRQVRRRAFLDSIRQLAPELICMEACGSAHYWGRCLEQEGYRVHLLPPHRVKPFVRGSKNDSNDAEAIAIAGLQPSVRPVAVKSLEQQDIQSLHRVRELAKQQRTAVVNQVRGLLAEYGIIIPVGQTAFRKALPEILEDGVNGLTERLRGLVAELQARYQALDKAIAAHDQELKALTEQLDACRRFVAVEGVGPQTATAFYAALGDGSQYRNGREAAAGLGLVPRQHSSGEREQLLGITKRGDRYLRTLLIHGARSMVRHAATMKGRRGQWLRELIERRGPNKAAVALANKNARVLWALLVHGDAYRVETGSTGHPA